MNVPALRALQPADADAVAALVRGVFADHIGRVDPPPSALRETGTAIAAILARGGGGVCAERDGALLACVVWEEKAGGLYLGRLSVHAAARGQGLGRALIEATVAEARRRGLPKVWLSTRITLTDNRRLFAANGFIETAQHAHAGYTQPTYVDMERAI